MASWSYRADLSGGVGVLPRQAKVQHVALSVGGGKTSHRKVGLHTNTGAGVRKLLHCYHGYQSCKSTPWSISQNSKNPSIITTMQTEEGLTPDPELPLTLHPQSLLTLDPDQPLTLDPEPPLTPDPDPA